MEEQVSPNRTELLRIKNRITTAKKGHSLLKKKRDGLVLDFFKLLKNAQDIRSEMSQTYEKAQKSLTKTRIVSFDLELKLYAKTTQGRNILDFQSKNIMGLSVPELKSEFKQRSLSQRQRTPYAHYSTDKTIQLYEKVVEQIIIVAELETAMIRLLNEIEKTKRRVNGLEFSIVPSLESALSRIQLSLDEQDRDTTIRLKKIKSKIEKKNY